MFTIENYKNIRKIHILKEKQMVYQATRDNDCNTQLFPIGCIFKSFLSVLVGIAIEEGKIQSIDDCLLDYFSHDDIENIEWYKLKIKHVLSKTTGIKWPGPGEPLPHSIDDIMRLSFDHDPGVEFKYKPDPQIIILLLETLYNTKIQNVLEAKLLSHFKHSDYQWDGQSDNMYVSIQVLDELGQLILSKGMIRGKKLFSENFYHESFQKYSNGGFPECNPYGLGWWLGEYSEIPYYYAAGFGGQILAVIPQRNIVISILSDMDRPHPENSEIIRSFIHSEIM